MNLLFARILSYLLHPVIYPLIGLLVVLKLLPYYIPSEITIVTFLFVFGGTYVVPLLVSFIIYRFGVIESMEMSNASDRRYPYMVGALSFYFTSNFIQSFPIPNEAHLFLLGSALVILVHLLMLGFFKPSAHLAGIGGFVGLLLALSLKYQLGFLTYIASALLLAGFLASARLYLKAHNPFEIVVGFLSGVGIIFGVILWL